MISRRTLLESFAGAVLTSPLAAFAQKPGKVHRIGFLGTAFASGYQRELEWIRAGLRRVTKK
jgi:hypothetical protein